MASPLFPGAERTGQKTVIAYAGAGDGAYWMELGTDNARRLRVSEVDQISEFRAIGSRAHDGRDLCGRFVERVGIEKLIRMDGQAKYLMLAVGQVDVYLRAADPFYGIAFPWDHCAGQVILSEAGGVVTGFQGEPLSYETQNESPMKDSEGLVASNGKCHERILELVREILEGESPNSSMINTGDHTMNDKPAENEKPDPAKMEVLRRLPKEIMRRLTKEEVDAFLCSEVWPDSLREKLKEYIVEND
jgi:hypothetical protein